MEELKNYFDEIEKRVRFEYKLANEAREKGFDPVDEVEIPLAMSLAEKVVGLISTIYPQLNDKKIVNRILELEQVYGQLDISVSFKIAEEIAKEKYCKFSSLLQAIDAGIRVGFAYTTLGVVSSPIEGFTGIKLQKTRDGKEYFIAYFSGPIRSAGTTASCVVLMIIDYLRELFGYAKYDPTEEEMKRYVAENYDYHERVTNLQYLPTEEEILFLAKNIPIQIAGDPTEKYEVSNFKDLPRVDTNFIRGGMCLCFSEGLAQKAAKGLRLLNGAKAKGLVSTGWDFLDDYIKLHKKRETGTVDTSPTYIKDLVAGRPVFGHPSRSGGFRFRYGRSRVSGFSAVSIHPATMGISNNFLSTGTQLKIEKPTKGCIVTSCDSIDGPIVKLYDGSVKRIYNFEEAEKIYKETEEIIYFGDILFPLGDVINRNSELLKPGYVEEWWYLDLKKAIDAKKQEENFIFLEEKINYLDVSFEKACELSDKYGISLYPNYIFYWTQISIEQFFWLLEWMQNAVWREKLILPYSKSVKEKFKDGKRALELLGVEHDVVFDNVVVKDGKALLVNLGLNTEDKFEELIPKIILENKEEKDILALINKISHYKIKDKAGTFIGTRMGRPEKAKLRKLTGSPNILFSIAEQGGRFRSVNESVKLGFVKADFPLYKCDNCNSETIYRICENCSQKTQKLNYCPVCDSLKERIVCEQHGNCRSFSSRKIDVAKFFNKAVDFLGISKENLPELVKGVRGTSSENHDFENLGKGILRAKFNLAVNKDGTIRYDATETPLTHFKPIEISVSVSKLKEIGYEKDILGKELEEENQILELKPHDILLPSCPETKDERADNVFLNIAGFIDSLLENFYKTKKYYEFKTREDLVGQLVVCMAPHNCAGVIGRIIGFSKTQGLVASPYIHAAMRRDCDGDEASIMLLMDVLLNFSRKFLPSHRGGTQDAPLVLNAHIRAGEVDDQILDFEVCSSYPLEMYELAEQGKHSSEVKIETVKKRLKEGKDPFVNIGFTHDTSNFNNGEINSSYKFFPTMKDKVDNQMDLVKKLRCVDKSDVARLIIERHLIRDIRGNLRKFSQQQFRCVSCNTKFRRPPMTGVCSKCNGKIIFTISEGSIKKYLDIATQLANDFNIPEYTKQGLELTKVYIESIFGKDNDKQIDLKKWF